MKMSGHDTHGGHMQAMFVPLESVNNHPDGKPANSLQVWNRTELLKNWFDDDISNAEFGAMYKAHLYAILSFVAILLTYSLSIYVAAVFAYLTGYFWSRVLISYAWSIEWFKGKPLIATK
ncbi:hypothetical protein HUU53_02105 [Candidatus Micrarchaeota archaeon]|nr:hypothetical protein [Candidatus Micrarchaeota archaeon]